MYSIRGVCLLQRVKTSLDVLLPKDAIAHLLGKNSFNKEVLFMGPLLHCRPWAGGMGGADIRTALCFQEAYDLLRRIE